MTCKWINCLKTSEFVTTPSTACLLPFQVNPDFRPAGRGRTFFSTSMGKYALKQEGSIKEVNFGQQRKFKRLQVYP